MALKISSKHLQIDKANQTIVILLSVAVFVTIFSLFACKAMLTKRAYQSRVIAGKELALKQLKSNVKAAEELNTSYKAFVSTPQNVIGGNPSGTNDRDGNNARIVLDALPSKYDFPALATSLEKILRDKNYTIHSISGSDDEVAQSGGVPAPPTAKSPSTTAPAAPASQASTGPVTIPFKVSVSGTYSSMQGLVKTLEQSIRPIQITTLSLSGNDSSLQLDIAANTYYQSEKHYTVSKKEIK